MRRIMEMTKSLGGKMKPHTVNGFVVVFDDHEAALELYQYIRSMGTWSVNQPKGRRVHFWKA